MTAMDDMTANANATLGSILGCPWIEVDGLDLPLIEIRRILRGNVQRIAFLDRQHRAFGMRAPSGVGRRISRESGAPTRSRRGLK